MAGSSSHEKKSTRRRGVLGTVVLLLLNMILMSSLAWFLLMLGFGVYRMTSNRDTTYRPIANIIQSNVALIRSTSVLTQNNNEPLYWTQKLINQINLNRLLLQQKMHSVQRRCPQLTTALIHLRKLLQLELLPLIMGVTVLILTKDVILLCALPLFLLCIGIGLVDGLVQRDIRKFQGARESAFLFHAFKCSGSFWFFMPLFIYLLLPWPITPQWLLVSTAIGLGVLTQLSARSFKKYL